MAGNDLKIKPQDYTTRTVIIHGNRQEDENYSVGVLSQLEGQSSNHLIGPIDLSKGKSVWLPNDKPDRIEEAISNSDHYNLFLLTHGGEDTFEFNENNNVSYIDINQALENKTKSLFIVKLPCYSGNSYKSDLYNLHEHNYKDSLSATPPILINALYFTHPHQLSRGNKALKSLAFYTNSALFDYEGDPGIIWHREEYFRLDYENNWDEEVQYDEAFRFMVESNRHYPSHEQSSTLPDMPMFFYFVPMGPKGLFDEQGRPYLGPFQRRDEDGRVYALPPIQGSSLHDLEVARKTLRPGQIMAVWVRPKGQPMDSEQESFFREKLHAPGMYRAMELELSPREWQKLYSNSRYGQKTSGFYFVNEYGIATSIWDLRNDEKLRKFYIFSVVHDNKERLHAYLNLYHSADRTDQFQALAWLTKDSEWSEQQTNQPQPSTSAYMIREYSFGRDFWHYNYNYIKKIDDSLAAPFLIAFGIPELAQIEFQNLMNQEDRAKHLKALVEFEKKPQDWKIYQALSGPIKSLVQDPDPEVARLAKELILQIKLHYSIEESLSKFTTELASGLNAYSPGLAEKIGLNPTANYLDFPLENLTTELLELARITPLPEADDLAWSVLRGLQHPLSDGKDISFTDLNETLERLLPELAFYLDHTDSEIRTEAWNLLGRWLLNKAFEPMPILEETLGLAQETIINALLDHAYLSKTEKKQIISLWISNHPEEAYANFEEHLFTLLRDPTENPPNANSLESLSLWHEENSRARDILLKASMEEDCPPQWRQAIFSMLAKHKALEWKRAWQESTLGQWSEALSLPSFKTPIEAQINSYKINEEITKEYSTEELVKFPHFNSDKTYPDYQPSYFSGDSEIILSGYPETFTYTELKELSNLVEGFNKYYSDDYTHVTWTGNKELSCQQAWEESRSNEISLRASLPHDPSQPISYKVSRALLTQKLSKKLAGHYICNIGFWSDLENFSDSNLDDRERKYLGALLNLAAYDTNLPSFYRTSISIDSAITIFRLYPSQYLDWIMKDNAEDGEDFKKAKLIGKIIWCRVRDEFFEGDVFTPNGEDPLEDFDYKTYFSE